MLRSVAAKTLLDSRRGFLWWSLGLIGLSALMVSVFPAVRDNPGLNRLAQDYPQALKGVIGFRFTREAHVVSGASGSRS